VPASIIALVFATLVVKIFSLNVDTIGSLYSNISSTIPMPSIPKINMDKLIQLIQPAITIAVLASIESLLSCVVSDKMIDDKHDSNSELVAQGFGNIASAIFGGIPATGAIARTAANVKNGGRSPIVWNNPCHYTSFNNDIINAISKNDSYDSFICDTNNSFL